MDAPPEGNAATQYAPRPAGAARRPGRRRIALFGGMAVLVLVPLFVSLGQWQWAKAERKAAQQAELDAHLGEPPVALTTLPADPETLRHRRVQIHGRYDAAHQVLIDNRIYREQAGYHVIAPLRLAGGGLVLVNRGWLAAPADHGQQPAAPLPSGEVTLTGTVVVPPSRFFSLGGVETDDRAPVWQNLDVGRFRRVLGQPLPDIVVQLDPATADGFVRDWPRPDERIERHRSYALQWYGFAVASVGIWLFFLVRRP